MPGLDHIRSQSLFGLSRREVLLQVGHRLQGRAAGGHQPPPVRPAPERQPGRSSRRGTPSARSSATRSRARATRSRELKTAEDWILERQWRQVPGVIDVTSFGGETKQYHVEVDPFRLRGHGVTLAQLTAAIQNANQNVGGQRLDIGEQSYDVRGIGLVRDVARHREHRRRRAEGRAGPRARRRRRSTSATRRASASSATTTTPTSSRASSSCATAARRRATLEGIHERVDYIRDEPPPAAGDGDRAVLRPRRRS